MEGYGLNSCGSGQGTVAGSCERSNETSSSMKGRVLYLLRNWWFRNTHKKLDYHCVKESWGQLDVTGQKNHMIRFWEIEWHWIPRI